MDPSFPSFQDVVKAQHALTEIRHAYFLHKVLFSPQWWLLVSSLILPWLVWWFIVDKRRITLILLYGCFVMVTSVTLDMVGGDLLFWEYPYKVIPWGPRLNTADLSILPVTFMLIYQFFNSWRAFIYAHIVNAALFAFIGEPLLNWLNIYVPLLWKHIYSFPAYIALPLLLRWWVEKIVSTQRPSTDR